MVNAVLKPLAKHSAIDQPELFQRALREWFEQFGHDYPWRRTNDPYAILVSEVMLQQTRLAVVLGKGYYTRFMERFPDVRSLAIAEESELLRVWEGLGYYRRARMLQATARYVLEYHAGVFPTEAKDLLALPGVGPYTVGALRSFAFDAPQALVDGNVMRVFSRLFDDATPIDSSAGIKTSWQRAESLLDHHHPRIYNSALMELGQKICKVGVPDCLSCPVSSFCRSAEPERLPIKVKQASVTHFDEHVIFARNSDGHLLLFCEQGKRREGLWRFPERTASEVADFPILYQAPYTITRYRVRLLVYECAEPYLQNSETWVPAELWESLPMAAPYRKVMRELLA